MWIEAAMIVGSDLLVLIKDGIVDNDAAFDTTSIALRLHHRIVRLEPPAGAIVDYGSKIPGAWWREDEIGKDGLTLEPRTGVLACSEERIEMTQGFIGLVQTKGSLARLFVAVTCCDGQVDTGYQGRITLEICNLATFPVRLRALQPVAQLFVFKASSCEVPLYHGRYQNAAGPTLSMPERMNADDELERWLVSARSQR